MKIIIIEDEKPAAEKLKKIILASDPTIQILAMLNSVQAATHWLEQKNEQLDLIFMDIELTDGLSFKIFDQCTINCPVIFTTAYDEYWQDALEKNSIDYLLKPIKKEKLDAAISKYRKLKHHFSISDRDIFRQLPALHQTGYRKRFLIKKGLDYISLKSDDIAYCYAEHKLVFIMNSKGQRFILDRSLNDLEKELDPAVFFRINRKYLANIHHIQRIKTLPKSKLTVELIPAAGEEIVISQENTQAFKHWIDN